MRVEDIMTTKVFTVEQHDLIDRVFFLFTMKKFGIYLLLKKVKSLVLFPTEICTKS